MKLFRCPGASTMNILVSIMEMSLSVSYPVVCFILLFHIFVLDLCDTLHFNVNICKLFLDMFYILTITYLQGPMEH